MNLIDWLIIYLACGAPFGVNYFFQNRKNQNTKLFLLESFSTFIFWLPFAFQLVMREKKLKEIFKIEFTRKHVSDAQRERNISQYQKRLEHLFCTSNLELSIYEFREIIERFIGLTLTIQNDGEIPSQTEENIFRAANRENTELSAKCLNRRNQKRLFYHQNLARRDFLQIIAKLFAFHSNQKELKILLIEFVSLLSDTEAKTALEQLFIEISPTEKNFTVMNQEKDLWKKEAHEPMPAQQIPFHSPAMTATTNSRSKD